MDTSQFVKWMDEQGFGPENPSDIIPDDKKRRYKVAGEKSKNATYQLKIEGDFVVGWIHPFKLGETLTFTSKPNKKYTKAEKEAFFARLEREKEKRELERRESQASAARKANELVKKSKKADPKHKYLISKKINKPSIYQFQNNLVIPAFEKNKIVNAQTIDEKGNKLFQEGGKTKGTYFALSGSKDSAILIAEGYATAQRLNEATNYPVAGSWYASNLPDVARIMRDKYPDRRIIICADNDQWSKNAKGEPYNAGIHYGKQAAVAVNGFCIHPDFLEDDKKKRTDFADYDDNEQILDRLAGVLSAKPSVAIPGGDSQAPDCESAGETYYIPPIDIYNEEVAQNVALYNDDTVDEEPLLSFEEIKKKCVKNNDDQLKSGSVRNALLFLKHDKALGRLFCYDEFSEEEMLVKCPPWEDPANFEVRSVRDSDYTNLAAELEIRGASLSIVNARHAVNAIIQSRRRNPAKEHFKSLRWDGVKRLDTWLQDYAGAVYDDAELVSNMGRKWLTASVARVFEPGKKFDYVLMLEGGQGTRKTTLLRELATINGRSYVGENVNFLDLKTESKIKHLQGLLIIELAELAGFKKMTPEERKSVITVQEDRVQLKYQNAITVMPRKFVLAGTYNPKETGYLDDATGERRYWTVKVDNIDIEGLREVKDQLWAEAVDNYQQGEPLYLCPRLEKKLVEAQKSRKAVDSWHEHLEAYMLTNRRATWKDLYEVVGADFGRSNKDVQHRLTDIMVSLGCKRKRIQHNRSRTYFWIMEDEYAE